METLTQTEFAELLGVSQPMVSKYIRDGFISERSLRKVGARMRIIPDTALDDFSRSLDPGSAKKIKVARDKRRSVMEEAGIESMSMADARAKHETYRAALSKLDYEKKRGEIVLKEQVKKDGYALGQLVKNKLTAIPSRLSALVAAETDKFQCEQLLKVEINAILDEMSRESLNLE